MPIIFESSTYPAERTVYNPTSEIVICNQSVIIVVLDWISRLKAEQQHCMQSEQRNHLNSEKLLSITRPSPTGVPEYKPNSGIVHYPKVHQNIRNLNIVVANHSP